MENKQEYEIKLCEGILNQGNLRGLLSKLPINFFLVNENIPLDQSIDQNSQGVIEVYHIARVISLYPPEGKRLCGATLIDMDFPLRSDNIMDEVLSSVRCCYHPRLTSFGLPIIDNWDEIEIDIHKNPRGHRYKKGDQI